jgi:hypothetical protein
MNLYDVMGPVAVGAGVGFSYGLAIPQGGNWLSLLVGAVAGASAFAAFRKITAQFTSERALRVMYVVTFIGTFTATAVGAWLVRSGAGA